MKRVGAVGTVFLLALAACASPASEPEQAAPTQVAEAPAAPSPPEPAPVPLPLPETAPPAPAAPPPAPVTYLPERGLICPGPAMQGGAILCLTLPNTPVLLDGKPAAVPDAAGLAVIGLSRKQKEQATLSVRRTPPPGTENPWVEVSQGIQVMPRTDTVSNLSMTCSQISAQTPEEKRKAEIAWVKKDRAMKVFNAPLAPIVLVSPIAGDFPLSSSFGATRTYTPKTKDCEPTVNVHNGTDIAVPTGTEIRAPMAGTVLLADPDLYYEGGAVFLDLGRGLVNVTMHMSRIDVTAGQVVSQGDLLGLSGATGRVTGPHLHWAIKYRNPNDPDRGSDIWLDPVLLMQLDSTKLPAW